MSDELPSVTVIIPARPDESEVKAATAARQLDYPADKLEIILARGRQPSVQRNTALRAAWGELIYFLDDDSLAPPGNLRRAVERFCDPKVQMVGGPNLCPPDAPPLEQVFALVLASWLAFGPSRARYTKVGAVRATSEKELILCNLVARRATLLNHGGFNEALYPNEENALMDEIQRAGGKLLYDPALFVYRRPRRTLGAFAKMLRTYGRGRAEQFRATPTFGSALNFVPPLFLVYLLTLPAVWAVTLVPAAEWERDLYELPLFFYGMAVLLQVIALIPSGGAVRGLCALPLIVLSHLLYGFGFWHGLFTRLKPPGETSNVPVKLEILRKE
ncbi:MAG: glycosyltransferase [Verrucomicrobia subdivision 3 bacterium]|nr:glycosyltransferase [Limisphaerales bacterium]